MGEAYTRSADYAKSEPYLQQSLKITIKNKSFFDQSQSLQALATLHLARNNLTKAEQTFKQSHAILEEKKHTLRYESLEGLSDIFLKKAHILQSQGNHSHAQALREQSKQNLQKAYEIIKVQFPDDSQHIARIQAKIKSTAW